MNNHTAAALHDASYQLTAEAKRAEQNAKRLREEAESYEARAKGLRDAAQVIQQALAEEAS